MNKEYFSQSESSTFQANQGNKPTTFIHLVRTLFALIVRHYMCTAIVLVRFRLKINLTPMLLEFIKVTKRKSTFHGINTVPEYTLIFKWRNLLRKRKSPLREAIVKFKMFSKIIQKTGGVGVWQISYLYLYFQTPCNTLQTPLKHPSTPFKHPSKSSLFFTIKRMVEKNE